MTSTASPTGFLARRDLCIELPLCILKSAAGYYIGTIHEAFGPVSRESEEYFSTPEQAEEALASGCWSQRLST